jgi:hypothetical protein
MNEMLLEQNAQYRQNVRTSQASQSSLVLNQTNNGMNSGIIQSMPANMGPNMSVPVNVVPQVRSYYKKTLTLFLKNCH